MSVNSINPELKANMSEEDYKVFKGQCEWKQKSLIDSRRCFEPLPTSVKNFNTREKVDSQLNYKNVPFRDESNGDFISTVASSGSALLVAKFVGRYFDCSQNISIPDLATMALELGYGEDETKSDGSRGRMSINPFFFDRFVPTFYGLKSRRMTDIFDVTYAIWSGNLPVLIVRSSTYKKKTGIMDNYFIALVGCDVKSESYYVYDPEYSFIRMVPYDQVNKAIRNGWVFSK